MFGKITNASRCRTRQVSLCSLPVAPALQQPLHPLSSRLPALLSPYLLNLSALVTSSPCPQSSSSRPRPLSRAPPTSLFPRSDWSLPAAPGASLTLGTLTTNVLQERKPSFPDLTPCDLGPRFLKGSGARQVRQGRGNHSPGGFFNRLFCRDRPSGTRHRPAWTCTKSGTGASGSSPTLQKQLGRWTFLRSPCDFFSFLNPGSPRHQNKEDRYPLRTYCFLVSSNLCSFLRSPPDLKPWQCAAGAPMVTMS